MNEAVSTRPARNYRISAALAATALLAAACGSSNKSSASTASTAPPATSATSPGATSTPAAGANTFGITSLHPDLTGMTINIANQGTPDIGRLNSFHVVSLLKSWGANASLFWASSPGIASSVMLSGKDQVLISTIPNLLPGVINGLHLLAFGLHTPRVDYALVSTKSYPSIQQLKGKTVGVYAGSPSDITWVLLNQALTASGMKLSDVNVVKAGGQSARTSQLAAGSLAATVVSHQALITLQSQGVNNVYDFSAKDPNLYNSVLWASPTWLKSNQKLATAVVLAELETDQWMNDPANQQAQVAEDLSNVPGSSAASVKPLLDVYQKYQLFAGTPILTSSALQTQVDNYFKLGTIPSNPPLSQWSTTTYGKAALAVLNGTANG